MPIISGNEQIPLRLKSGRIIGRKSLPINSAPPHLVSIPEHTIKGKSDGNTFEIHSDSVESVASNIILGDIIKFDIMKMARRVVIVCVSLDLFVYYMWKYEFYVLNFMNNI